MPTNRFYTPTIRQGKWLVFIFVVCCSFLRAQDAEKEARYTAIVNDWNNAHNNWHFADLEKLYAEKVLFYCSTMPRKECIGYKTGLASPTKVFAQRILSKVECLALAPGLVKCTFSKQVIIDDKKAEYPAYLVLREDTLGLRIICEGDEITDASFGFKLTPELFNNATGEPMDMEEGQTGERGMAYWKIAAPALLILIVAFAALRRKRTKEKTNDTTS